MAEETTNATVDQTPEQDTPKPDRTFTQEEVNAMVEERLARSKAKWQKEQEEAVSEAARLAEMNAAEKAEYERDKLQKELEELKAANIRTQLAAEARKMLAADEINLPDELVDVLVQKDAESTKTAVTQFSALFTSAVQKAVKEAVKGTAPRTGSSSGVTKEQILAIKDTYQRQKAISENMHLFKGE